MRPERERLTSQDGFSTAFCWASPAAWVQSDGEISKRAPAAPRAGHSVSSQLTFHCCFMLCRSIGYVLSLIQFVWRAAASALPCHMPLLRSCGLLSAAATPGSNLQSLCYKSKRPGSQEPTRPPLSLRTAAFGLLQRLIGPAARSRSLSDLITSAADRPRPPPPLPPLSRRRCCFRHDGHGPPTTQCRHGECGRAVAAVQMCTAIPQAAATSSRGAAQPTGAHRLYVALPCRRRRCGLTCWLTRVHRTRRSPPCGWWSRTATCRPRSWTSASTCM